MASSAWQYSPILAVVIVDAPELMVTAAACIHARDSMLYLISFVNSANVCSVVNVERMRQTSAGKVNITLPTVIDFPVLTLQMVPPPSDKFQCTSRIHTEGSQFFYSTQII